MLGPGPKVHHAAPVRQPSLFAVPSTLSLIGLSEALVLEVIT
jgi:hypothetical protein